MLLWALWLILAILAPVCGENIHHLFAVRNGSVDDVNGIYVAKSSNSYVSLNRKYQLGTASVLVNSKVQKRWYLERIVHGSPPQRIYQAVEVSNNPFQLSEWKTLSTTGLHLPLVLGAAMQPWSAQCTVDMPLPNHLEIINSLQSVLAQFTASVPTQKHLRHLLSNCFDLIMNNQASNHQPNNIVNHTIPTMLDQSILCSYYLHKGGMSSQSIQCMEKSLSLSWISSLDNNVADKPVTEDGVSLWLHSMLSYALYNALVEMKWSLIPRLQCELLALREANIFTESQINELKFFWVLKWMESFLHGKHDYQFELVNTGSVVGNSPTYGLHIIFHSSSCHLYPHTTKSSVRTPLSLPVIDVIESIQLFETMLLQLFPHAIPVTTLANAKELVTRCLFYLTQIKTSVHANIVPHLIACHQQEEGDSAKSGHCLVLALEHLQDTVVRMSMSFSSSIISSLLTIGAMETSGLHLYHVLLEQQIRPQYDEQDGVAVLEKRIAYRRQLSDCVQLRYDPYAPSWLSIHCDPLLHSMLRRIHTLWSSDEWQFYRHLFGTVWLEDDLGVVIQTSSTMRLLVLLMDLFAFPEATPTTTSSFAASWTALVTQWQEIVPDEQLYHITLSILSQLYNPVILSNSFSLHSLSNHSSSFATNTTSALYQDYSLVWMKEIILARMFMVKWLEGLLAYCQPSSSTGIADSTKCWQENTILSSMNRGLFLEAYQGMGLIIKYVEQQQHDQLQGATNHFMSIPSWLYDGYVTSLYQQIITFSVPSTPLLPPSLIHSLTNATTDLQNEESPPSLPIHTRIIPIAFVCDSLTRHSVGRLLTPIISGLAETTAGPSAAAPAVQYEVYLITSSPHPSVATSRRESDDEITAYLAKLIPPARWLVYPSVTLSFPQVNNQPEAERTPSLHYHPQWTNFLYTIQQTIKLQVVIFTDVLMQPVQMIWTQQVRLAPVQVVFWGHPYTTGNIPFMDYFITSDTFEPAQMTHSRSHQFTEQLVHFTSLSFQLFPAEPIASQFPSSLPSSLGKSLDARVDVGTCVPSHLTAGWMKRRWKLLQWLFAEGYALSTNQPFRAIPQSYQAIHQLSPTDSVCDHLTSLVSRVHIYSLLQTLMKMHPLLDDYLLALLLQDPYAVIIVSRQTKQTWWQQAWQTRLHAKAVQLLRSLSATQPEGTEGDKQVAALLDRIIFLSPMKHSHYSRVICSVDLVLDSFPFGGGVTLCDAVGGACYVDKEEENKDSKGQSIKQRHVIPFVTSGVLQTVHQIGQGIEQMIQSHRERPGGVRDNVREYGHSITVSSDHSLWHNESASFLARHIQGYYHEQILAYVRKTHEKMKTIWIARNDTNSVVDSKGQDGQDDVPKQVIYEDLQALEEWKQFLARVAS